MAETTSTRVVTEAIADIRHRYGRAFGTRIVVPDGVDAADHVRAFAVAKYGDDADVVIERCDMRTVRRRTRVKP